MIYYIEINYFLREADTVMSKLKYLECGKIINTHGVRGGLKLESWCDSPSDLAALDKVYLKIKGEYEQHRVKRASVFKQFVLMEIDGVNDIDAASALRGKILYADREDISVDEGAYFIADIIGLPIIDELSGEKLGVLSDVINLGASDIYVVKTESGEGMIPAVPEFIKRVDTESGIYVALIEGMLD